MSLRLFLDFVKVFEEKIFHVKAQSVSEAFLIGHFFFRKMIHYEKLDQ